MSIWNACLVVQVRGRKAQAAAAAAAAGGGSGSCPAQAADAWYKRTAATVEAFLQTSTVGEFEERLRLLDSFHAHLEVRCIYPMLLMPHTAHLISHHTLLSFLLFNVFIVKPAAVCIPHNHPMPIRRQDLA
jgi:hypothetical protein